MANNTDNNWTWIGSRVPRDGIEVQAMEFIKDSLHYSNNSDALRAALIEYARTLGFQEMLEVSPTP